MAFKAILLEEFYHSYEKEFFNRICNDLYKKYDVSNDLVLFIGNINYIKNQIDAILIKKDMIFVIDFKNYSGDILFNENSKWLFVKDNKREDINISNFINPLHQISEYRKIVHAKLIDFFKDYFERHNVVYEIYLNHITALIITHNKVNIININELRETQSVKRYFQFCDYYNLDRVIDESYSNNYNFSNLDIELIFKKITSKDISSFEEYKFSYNFDNQDNSIKNNNDINSNKKLIHFFNLNKYIFITILALVFLSLITYFSIQKNHNEIIHENIVKTYFSKNTEAVFINRNYDKNYLKKIINDKGSFNIHTINGNFVLNEDNIDTLYLLKNTFDEENIQVLKNYFKTITYSDNIDSIFIIGDVGNLKSKMLTLDEVSNYVIIEKEFWDSFKKRNNPHLEIISNNENSNLRKIIETKRNEKLNNYN